MIKNTNHILHAIMTVCTGGLWGIVWLVVGLRNNSHNAKVRSSEIKQEEKKEYNMLQNFIYYVFMGCFFSFLFYELFYG